MFARNRNTKDTTKESMNLDQIILDLEDAKKGKSQRIKNYEGPQKDKVEKLNDLICANCSNHNTFIREINSLMQTLMKMDFVKEMIKGADTQATMVETIAATSQEMASNNEDIAEFVKNSLTYSQDSKKRAENSKALMNDTILSIDKSYNETEFAKEEIIRVNEQTEKIDEMVNIIISVAAQTNLLALNATIEAARAGESGKGFAVVANEIKKLADHTKESVNYIQESVKSLRTQIQSSTQSIEKASKSFLDGKKSLGEVMTAIEDVEISTEEIERNMQQINLNIEQQTASSQEIASSTQMINEKTRYLHEDSIKTGKGFYQISLEIDDIRKELIKDADMISDYDSVALCLVDHLNWRWRVYNMILGNTQIEADLVRDPRKSRLGRWIENIGSKRPHFQQDLKLMERPREKMHEIASHAVTAYNSGDVQKAEDYLAELDKASDDIVQILRNMQGRCREN